VAEGADHRLQQFHEVVGVAFAECASANHASHEQHRHTRLVAAGTTGSVAVTGSTDTTPHVNGRTVQRD
jgi:hypothetical protein